MISLALAAALVSVRVSLDAPLDTGYELRAGASQKIGRTGPLDGYHPEDVIEAAAASNGAIPVSLKFYDMEGLVASCPEVAVGVFEDDPMCQPKFKLQGKTCSVTCAPTKSQRKKTVQRYLPPIYY